MHGRAHARRGTCHGCDRTTAVGEASVRMRRGAQIRTACAILGRAHARWSAAGGKPRGLETTRQRVRARELSLARSCECSAILSRVAICSDREIVLQWRPDSIAATAAQISTGLRTPVTPKQVRLPASGRVVCPSCVVPVPDPDIHTGGVAMHGKALALAIKDEHVLLRRPCAAGRVRHGTRSCIPGVHDITAKQGARPAPRELRLVPAHAQLAAPRRSRILGERRADVAHRQHPAHRRRQRLRPRALALALAAPPPPPATAAAADGAQRTAYRTPAAGRARSGPGASAASDAPPPRAMAWARRGAAPGRRSPPSRRPPPGARALPPTHLNAQRAKNRRARKKKKKRLETFLPQPSETENLKKKNSKTCAFARPSKKKKERASGELGAPRNDHSSMERPNLNLRLARAHAMTDQFRWYEP